MGKDNAWQFSHNGPNGPSARDATAIMVGEEQFLRTILAVKRSYLNTVFDCVDDVVAGWIRGRGDDIRRFDDIGENRNCLRGLIASCATAAP
ncbi:LOW QUALITY PROTEIN: hypothetical protein ACHAXH_003422 [Discostella pseudostelligera]